MITIILTLICFIAAAYFKAHMDAIDDLGIKSSEWKSKYQLDDWYNPVNTQSKNHWWYFGLYQPTYAEKFPFSSTALVFLTDRWHAYQMMTYRFMYLGASFGITNNNTTSTSANILGYIHAYNQTDAVTSLEILPSSGNWTSGTVLLYGVS
jgi:hypothetical protein